MKFSIITPSFNQATFLKKTIQSVVSQKGNFKIEYIVIDGGSNDKSIDILKNTENRLKNNPKITFIWKSEKDKGQSDAINKGLKIATGDIVSYINSDDTYQSGCFSKILKEFNNNPQKKWLTGYCHIINENNKVIQPLITLYKNLWLNFYNYKTLLVLNYICQPATFWRREIITQNGSFNNKLHYSMDYDYWLKIGKKNKPIVVKNFIVNFRIHSSSKGQTEFINQFKEDLKTSQKYTKNSLLIKLHKLHNYFIILIYKIIK